MDATLLMGGAWPRTDFFHWIYRQVNVSTDSEPYVRKSDQSDETIRNQLCRTTSDSELDSKLLACERLKTLSYNGLFINMMNTWQNKKPESWDNADILDWIYFTAGLNNIQLSALRGENFQGLAGKEFCRMSKEEFIKRDPEFGESLYDSFSSLVGKHSEVASPTNLTNRSCLVPQPCSQFHELTQIQFQPAITLNSITNQSYARSSSDEKFHWSEPPSHGGLIPATVQMSEMQDFSDDEAEVKQEYKPKCTNASSNKRKRKRLGDSKSSSDDSSQQGINQKVLNMGKRKHSSKILLSNFMRDLLESPDYNPSCVRWEDKDNGIFRIISGKSKLVAELWGKIKNNPKMTFEKMGRSLRWCRDNNGNFSTVPKDGNLPKKLCFRLST